MESGLFGGWLNLYDPKKGIQGQIQIKIALKTKKSPQVKFLCGIVPPQYKILEVIGFVEELIELKC